ncbi:MAG TPA: DMT family transporter [Nocardioidaceae bacterium]|jgi:drug/metabolite transporter (DMT)-like permease|nr:DMT family transporter [Nocardioidaceae bacterium]
MASAPPSPRSGLATLALIGVTATWGSTFFLIKDLLDRVPVLDFLAVRFAIATVVLVLVAPKAVSRLSPRARWHGITLGLVYGVAQILQTTGLGHTSASVSGFVTGMYVVLTPVFGAALLRQRIGRLTWVAVALATAGLAVLSLRGFAVGYGEALTFVAAMLYAVHILGLGAWSTQRDALGLSVLQMAVITVVCMAASAPDGIVLPSRADDWVAIVYMALVAGALALLAQTWAQAHLTATRAAIVMTMEPVFAAFFAVLLGGELLTLRMLLGGGLVLAAMYLVELLPRRKVEGEVQHLVV